MHKRKHVKRCLAFISAFVLSLSPIFATATTLGTPAYSTSIQIAPDAFLKTVVATSDAGALKQACYIEFSPQTLCPAVAYGSKLYGKSTVLEILSYVESQGSSPVAAINGDYFALASGLPVGLVIAGGVIKSSDAWQNAVGFTADGSAVIGRPLLNFVMTTSYNQTINVSYVNKARTSSGIYLMTDDFSSESRITGPGTDVLLEIMEEAPLVIGSRLKLRVKSVAYSEISTAIPKNHMLLTVDSTASVTLPDLSPGEEITLTVSSSDERWAGVTYAVGGGDILISGGAIPPALSKTASDPRSAIGVKSDGTVVFFTVDGRQPAISTGLSLHALATELKALGCVDAINLDGGGSTTLAVKYPGQDSYQIVNSPSDGSQRKVANAVVLVNNLEKTNTPARLHLYPYDSAMLKGASVSFDIRATDENFYAASAPQPITLSQSKTLGTIAGNTFTANAAGTTVLKAVSGMISGSAGLTIYDDIDFFDIINDPTGEKLGSLSLAAGDMADLGVNAYKNQRKLISDDSLFRFSAPEKLGIFNESGIFTAAADAMGLSGLITVSYGDKTASVPATCGAAPVVLDAFENASWSQTEPGDAELALNTNYDYVRYGKASLPLSYEMSTQSQTVRIVPKASIAINRPSHLNLWVYGDGSGNAISLETSDSSGMVTAVSKTLDFTGYRLLSFELPAGSTLLRSIAVLKTQNGKNSGVVYLDQLSQSYKLAVPESASISVSDLTLEAPAVDTARHTLKASVTGTLKSDVSSGKLSVLLDGSPIPFTFSNQTGLLTASIGNNLSEGLHKLTVTAADALGNLSRAYTSFELQKASNQSYPDIDKHWASGYIRYLASKSVIPEEILDEKGGFGPEKAASRLDVAVMTARYLGYLPKDYADVQLPYTDLADIPEWAVGYIGALYKNSVMLGLANTKSNTVYFAPNADITRAETMTLFGRLTPKGYTLSDTVFKDDAQIPSWSAPYVRLLCSAGIITGYTDNTIQPGSKIKRSEISTILFKLF